MGRLIGLIGCTCLVIAAMRLTNLSHVESTTLKGGEARKEAQAKLTPRASFKLGKERYLRGRYIEALPLLEEASAATSGLTASERRINDDYLNRARGKVQELADSRRPGAGLKRKPVVRAQSQSWDEIEADVDQSAEEAARDRVEQLMIQAMAAFKNGNKAEAMKLAKLADHAAKSAKLTFAKNKPTPGDLLAKLVKADTNIAKNDAAKDDFTPASTIRQVAGSGNARGGIQLAGATNEESDDEPFVDESLAQASKKSHKTASLKERALTLIAEAKNDLKEGRLEDAKRHALEANELGASYGVLEERPEHVLADIDRKMKTTTLARQAAPKSAKQAAVEFGDDSAEEPQAEVAGGANESAASKKLRAVELLKQARAELEAGRFDAAKKKVEQAQELRVAFKLWEDMPEVVLNDIEERRAENVAQGPGKSDNDRSENDAAQAKQLIAKSKKAMKDGQFDEARELALQAQRLKVAFGLFDPSNPEVVLNEIARAEHKATQRSVPPTSAVEGDNSTAVAQQKDAINLLRQARQLIKERRFDEARLKALHVEDMGVELPGEADSPDLVLADLEKAESIQLTSKVRKEGNEVKTAKAEEDFSDDAPAAPRRTRLNAQPAAKETVAVAREEIPEFSQSGLSARELYQRGMTELHNRRPDVAYQAFKAAHETGQRLDPISTQRLSVYLRELKPKSDIRLANNESESATESAPLDAARQEQLVKLERVRDEVMNALFRAERLKESEPEKAMELIDQTLAKVESAELSVEAAAPLLKQLNRSRSSLRSTIEQQAPNLALKAENKRVKDRIQGEVENAVRIDQELAKLTEEFNDLLKQERYDEANVVAKKANALNPKDPAVVQMVLKGQFAMQRKFNEDLKRDKEGTRLRSINELERGLVHDVGDDHPMSFDTKIWDKISDRKNKYAKSNRTRSETELETERSLLKKISLHEDNTPLTALIAKIKSVADINIVIDDVGLEEVGVSSNTSVTIDVENITVKSALNLILQRFELGYMFDNEVLMITNRQRQQGKLVIETYSVTDLVIPIPNFGVVGDVPFNTGTAPTGSRGFGPQAYLDPTGGGQVFAQVGPNGAAVGGAAPRQFDNDGKPTQTNRNADFSSLTDLITSTISPESWEQSGGEASLKPYPGTLSLVIRQTQKVHEEIHDLLEQLRRLQDLQVTIEVRFVTVADRFFERIGIDFDFNIKPTTGYAKTDQSGLPIPNFGSVLLPQSGFLGSSVSQTGQTGGTAGGQAGGQVGGQAGGQAGGQVGGQAGTTGQTGQTTTGGLFTPFPGFSLVNNPKNTTIVGLQSPDAFTNDLTVPFQQGSFNVGIPQFGGYNPSAGVQTGVAILSDLEAFFFIQAAQGDQRTNLLFAPKVTLFNGQSATVQDNRQRPFVTSLIPTVGIAAVGYTPVITPVNEGITLTATAVVSADRRFVRLTLIPIFRSITDVFTFQASGSGSGGQQGQGQGQGGFGGGQFGGGGGGQAGGQAGGGGQLGIGGGLGSMQIMQSLFAQQQAGGVAGGAGGGGGIGGAAGQAGGQTGAAGQVGGGTQITVQQPVIETVNVSTTVSVPDGGTVLMGGIKRLKEGRTMSGVPILNKIPYVSRLFRNSGVGRETESLMLMVTPRIIIQEEEESLLGVSKNN